ncbi:MAG: cellulose biosynthesis cyclic di-GMP-binding regulatory protein BcsB [Candidatus Melainabacteria bacterium]
MFHRNILADTTSRAAHRPDRIRRALAAVLTAAFLVSPVTALVLPAGAETVTPETNPATPPAPQPDAPMIASIPKSTATSQTVSMADMGNPDGYTLKTVRTFRDYFFTRPRGWKVLPSSRVHVQFQHSPALLKERSALNILVNNRILKTVRLGDDNVKPNTFDVNIPADLLKDENTLTFQVDQHYTYDCEDPFSEELWTTILDGTYMTLDYQRLPVKPDLAKLPYPLFDNLNSYTPTRVGFVMPAGLSDASLDAAATLALHMGQQVRWRDYKPFLADPNQVGSGDNLVLVGTPAENSAIAGVADQFEVKLSGGKFVDAKGSALPNDYGVIQLIADPSVSSAAILVISGNGPEGVRRAAKALVQSPVNKMLVGRSAVVKDLKTGPETPYRAWEGFVQHSGDNFYNLGLETQTARGITSLPLFYKLKLMPDLFLPGKTKAKVRTVYSYSSQVTGDQSKLEVRLNGKTIKSVPLNDPKGKSLAEFTVEIPAEQLFTYNDLEYKFHLFPEKYDVCRFTTDVHIWGTIHNTTSVELPGEIKTAVPDVGLLNDGGFPFSAYQDFSQTTVVVPQSPTHSDLETMLQLVSRLGRESHSQRGIRLTAFHANSLPGDAKGNNLIVVGLKDRISLMKDIDAKARLLTEKDVKTLKGVDGKLADLGYTTDQGILEEMISPWNNKRVLLLATAQTEEGLKRVADLFATDSLFAKLQPGNIAVVNQDGPRSVIVMEKGDARFLVPNDIKEGFQLPTWAVILIGVLSVLGLVSVIRFLFGR